jgi:anti-sigma regulatory factor (Ser/Thr protein kinase)
VSGTIVEVLRVASLIDAVVVASTCYRVCQERGFPRRFATETAIVTQELATNIVKHGGGQGTIAIQVTSDCVELTAIDQGPGIDSIEMLVGDGSSRGGVVTRGTRTDGLGCGGGAISRLSDHLSVERRPEGGARIVVTKRVGGQ